jgi:hypothetical protein
MLLLPGQTGEARGPSDKEGSIADRVAVDREALSGLFFPQTRTRITEGAPKDSSIQYKD